MSNSKSRIAGLRKRSGLPQSGGGPRLFGAAVCITVLGPARAGWVRFPLRRYPLAHSRLAILPSRSLIQADRLRCAFSAACSYSRRSAVVRRSSSRSASSWSGAFCGLPLGLAMPPLYGRKKGGYKRIDQRIRFRTIDGVDDPERRMVGGPLAHGERRDHRSRAQLKRTDHRRGRACARRLSADLASLATNVQISSRRRAEKAKARIPHPSFRGRVAGSGPDSAG